MPQKKELIFQHSSGQALQRSPGQALRRSSGQALQRSSGQAILSLIFLIGGIIAMLGLTLAFLATSFINVTSGFEASAKAQAAAVGGANDALLRLTRAKGLSGTYSVSVGDASANVTVTPDSPSVGLVAVVSSSTVSRRNRIVEVVVSRNATSGESSVISWRLKLQ